MKYTIEGFYQERAISLGLDAKDLIFLRWLTDFQNTKLMERHLFEGVEYYWVDYGYVIRELPILGIKSKDVLARRLRHLESCQVLDFKCFAGAGNKTYFRFREDIYFSLVSSPDMTDELSDPNGGGSYPKVGRVPTQKSEGFLPKSREYVDSSIKDSSINDTKLASPVLYLNEKAKTRFNPNLKSTVRLIKARLAEGRTVDQFRIVIDRKCTDWLNDEKMYKYLRPSTLFNATNFENYLNQKEGVHEWNRECFRTGKV